ncbi:Cell division control protein 48-like protein B [Bienertia sinuspersici]
MERESSISSNEPNTDEWRAEEAIAGNYEALQALRELIAFPLLYSSHAQFLGLKWRHGLLLYGPPGTDELGTCSGQGIPHTVHRAHVGESEKVLRKAFTEASSHVMSGKPSVIFIDEIDALCPRRASRREQDARLTSQLFTLMDSNRSTSTTPQFVVVASTNRIDAIDPALRRSGRFDAEIEVTTPNERERLQILMLYTRKLPLDPCTDLQAIAASSNGYVGADLEALCREAAMSAVQRSKSIVENDGVWCITMDDWKLARSIVGPSITRGVTVDIPKVSWDDIGGLNDLKKKLRQAVEWPIKHASAFSKMGVSPLRGILLHGPPGCSKTTLAKAAAHAAQASFFSLSGAELYSMYVGEGEALLRNTFRRARLAAPSILFFDEADRWEFKWQHFRWREAPVNGILVLAATNRPQAIDPALMRPGRFDLVLYVPPPNSEARYEILRVHTRNMKLGPDVNLQRIAEATDWFTGAELEGLCREAGIVALRENIYATIVTNGHFQTVKNSLKPALTKEDIDSYSRFMKNSALQVQSVTENPSTSTGKLSYSLNTVTIGGILSLLVVAAAKYLPWCMVPSASKAAAT